MGCFVGGWRWFWGTREARDNTGFDSRPGRPQPRCVRVTESALSTAVVHTGQRKRGREPWLVRASRASRVITWPQRRAVGGFSAVATRRVTGHTNTERLRRSRGRSRSTGSSRAPLWRIGADEGADEDHDEARDAPGAGTRSRARASREGSARVPAYSLWYDTRPPMRRNPVQGKRNGLHGTASRLVPRQPSNERAGARGPKSRPPSPPLPRH